MRFVKLFLKIILVIIFVCSIVLNILLFNSSYGSLVFKYDENKFWAMHEYSLFNFENALSKKNSGLQLEATNTENCDKFTVNFNIDKDGKVTFASECAYSETINNEVKHYSKNVYFTSGKVYISDKGSKTYEVMSLSSAIATHTEFYDLVEKHINIDQTATKEYGAKTSIGLSFSPFYVIGINYSYKNDIGTEYDYDYDLNGLIRKIKVVSKEDGKKTEKELKINYDYEKISFPDFSQFELAA